MAVTTACGGSLQSLITDTIEQGQAVIEHLRKTSAGRANIFVLDKLPSRDLAPIATPEDAPRLFDLIKPKDPRFAPAFFKATGQTLVATDLAQANRLAYGGKKRWRVVTLSGDLIDVSGAMSGGGTRVQRGGMSSKLAADRVEPAVLARYEKETEEAVGALAEFQEEKKRAEAEVAELQRRVPTLDIAITKMELDIKNGEKRVAEVQRRVSELQCVNPSPASADSLADTPISHRSQSKPNAGDEKRIVVLDKEIATLTASIAQLRSKAEPIEASIHTLQQEILSAGGVKLRSQKSKVDNTRLAIELASDKTTKAEVAQAQSAKDSEKLARAIAANEGRLAETEAALEALEGEARECEAGAREVKELLARAEEAAAVLVKDLEESKEKLDEAQGAIDAFRAREVRRTSRLACRRSRC